MATIKPFKCIRPQNELAARVAALPYDVYNRSEAKEAAAKEELSFLRIDRAETQLPDDVDTYDDSVYAKARELFEDRIKDNTYMNDEEVAYYIYELVMDGRSQTGIVACAAIDDYINNVIKKHENTREEKEQDRIRHVDTLSAQTGPIFLAYRSDKTIADVVNEVKTEAPLYSFTADDGIRHTAWKIAGTERVSAVEKAFSGIDSIYIADGHHRAASAVKVGIKRRNENPGFKGDEEFNYFLSVLFPEDQLMIMPYNRVVKDLNGFTKEEFIAKVKECFDVESSELAYAPDKKSSFGMYLDGAWYKLSAKAEIAGSEDPVEALDVSVLQNYLLKPVLGIEDPRTDKRIDFIGGIRGLKELERRVSLDMTVAFSMYPTSIRELFAVSDADKLMPPKSTWFEPKLRSGLFIHSIQ